MQIDSDAILEAALKLPEKERLALVSKIMQTMPAEDITMSLDDPEFAEELERRSRDLEGTIPWSELRAESECKAR